MSKGLDITADKALTERELIILQLIADGMANREIALCLSLSINTVKWHSQQIYSKLDVKSRTQAVATARSLALLGEGAQQGSDFVRPAMLAPKARLVGREQELADLNNLLDSPDVGLVTILGPGGIGKSRLAQALAEQQQATTSQPVVFVSLEAVAVPDQVVTAVAGALVFQFGSAQPPKEQLLNYLRDTNLLLILDNFEHLLDAATLVTEMLEVSRRLKVLTTSRVRLNLRGEVVFALQGLSYPVELLDLERFSAVQLFLQGARHTRYNVRLAASDMEQVGRICHLVEGMPLAIEIASGWVDVLSTAEIAAEIERNLSILTTRTRDMPERHRSIEAVFEHSWRLLTETEQETFKKLAVFRGGFDRTAAEQVAGASIFVLSTLIDKSLVKRVGADRFAVHELLRQFAETKLRIDQSTHQATLERHCCYYADQMIQYELEMTANFATVTSAFLRIGANWDNILAGWTYAVEVPLIREINKFVYSLGIFLHSRGMDKLAAKTFNNALDQYESSPQSTNESARARLLAHSGWFAFIVGDHEQGEKFVGEALAIFIEHDEEFQPHDAHRVLMFNAWTLLLKADIGRAKQIAHKAVALNQATHHSFGLWEVYNYLGQIAFIEQNFGAAIEHYIEAQEIAESNQFLFGSVYEQSLMGCAYAAHGNMDAAYSTLRQTLELNRLPLLVDPTFWVLIGMANLQAKLGYPRRGLEILGIILYHPQGGMARPKAELVFRNLQSLIPADQVDAILASAEQGTLSTDFLNANFRIDAKLIEHLTVVLDQMQIEMSKLTLR